MVSNLEESDPSAGRAAASAPADASVRRWTALPVPPVDLVLLAVFGVLALLFIGPWPAGLREFIGHLSLSLPPLAAAVLFLISARRAPEGNRIPWLLYAAAAAGYGLGHALWSVRQGILGQVVLFPSVSTYLILSFNVLFALGALLALRPARVRQFAPEIALDTLLAGLLATVLLLRYVIEPLRDLPWVGSQQAFWMLAWQLTGLAAAFCGGLLVVWREAALPPATAAALALATAVNVAGILMVGALLDPDPVHPGHAFTLVWAGSQLLLLRAAIGGVLGWGPWTARMRRMRFPAVFRHAIAASALLLLGAAAAGLLGGDRELAYLRVPLVLLTLALILRAALGTVLAEREAEDRRALAQTRALVEVSSAIATAQDLDPALELVARWSQKLLNARGAAIQICNPDQSLTVRVALGSLARARDATMPQASSLLAWLAAGAEQARPRTAPMLSAIPSATGLDLDPATPVAAAPLRFGTRMQGVLILALKERPLYPGELELLGALAEQAAVALENHRQAEDMRAGERRRFQAEKLSTVGQLAGGIAHEINNPLAAIQSAAELLLDDPGIEPESQRLLSLVRSEARRAGVIVRNLLELVRPREARIEAVDVAELIADTLRLRSYAHGLQNIAVLTDLEGASPVRGDADRLRQVLLNLIVNAEQALTDRPHPRIEIHARTRAAEVEIRIADNGPGLPLEHLDKLFDPFFTTKAVGQGTGLGLSVAYGILRDMGGSVRAANGSEGGAEFTITLPVADAALAPQAPAAGLAPADDVTGATASVLLVDDEQAIREVAARSLRRAGFSVELARSGEDALELLQRQRFDVILSDIRMPGIGGEGLYRRLQEMNIPVLDRFIFISGDIVAEATTAFLASTGRPYLLKPFELNELLAAVREVAAGH